MKVWKDAYADWVMEEPENAQTSLKSFAMEQVAGLSGDSFEDQNELKRHVYASGSIAGRTAIESRS